MDWGIILMGIIIIVLAVLAGCIAESILGVERSRKFKNWMIGIMIFAVLAMLGECGGGEVPIKPDYQVD